MLRPSGTLRVIALLLAMVFWAGACGGGSDDAERADRTTEISREVEARETAEEEADQEAEATPDAPGDGEPATLVAPNGVEVASEEGSDAPPVADLFTPEEDTIGLHDNRIVLCAHAATSFGAAFNTSERDLNVYWDEVGEIHGRRVQISFENDNYNPNDARVAAEACRQKNPFLLLGGIGFDQIPAVRRFAEDNRIPYLHHMAREDLSKRFSFSSLPSVERMGELAAQWVAAKYPGKRVGIIYRESENWEPGRSAFVRHVRQTNDVVVNAGVPENQGAYIGELNAFRSQRVDVGFIWENALAATNIIQQAKAQNMHLNWIIFPFNLTTDVLRGRALNPPVEGVAAWPAYSPGEHGGPFAEYADEIRRMERAYARHRPGVEVTDIHWQVWLAWREIHRMLDACGRDCTRNKLIGQLLWRQYGYEETRPMCPVDFTRNGHVGGFSATMFTAYAKGGGAGWRHIPDAVCRERF